MAGQFWIEFLTNLSYIVGYVTEARRAERNVPIRPVLIGLIAACALWCPSLQLHAADKRGAGSPCKTYAISLAAGKFYQIDVSSKYFDTFVRLENGKAEQVAFNDNANAGTFDSRIVCKAEQMGEYKIIVTAADGKFGKFTVTVREVSDKTPLLVSSRFAGKPKLLELRDGETRHDGELNEKSPAALSRYYQLFELTMEAGKAYRFRAVAADPKTLTLSIMLEDQTQELLTSSGFSKDASKVDLLYVPKTSGRYRVIITTKPQQQTGKYTLFVAVQ